MNIEDIQPKLLTLLTEIAPDVEPASVDPLRNFRDQFDFDSMDTLHFAGAISEAFGIDIAESDYQRLANLQAAAQFVQSRLPATAQPQRA
jgi:acyl carrier protein